MLFSKIDFVGGHVHTITLSSKPPFVNSVDGYACSRSSSDLAMTLAPVDEPIAEGNLLGLGGFETDKELTWLGSSVNDMGHFE